MALGHRATRPAGTAWSACVSGSPSTAAGWRAAAEPAAATASARVCRSSDRQALAGTPTAVPAHLGGRRDDRTRRPLPPDRDDEIRAVAQAAFARRTGDRPRGGPAGGGLAHRPAGPP